MDKNKQQIYPSKGKKQRIGIRIDSFNRNIEMEQDLLTSQGDRASIIISKDGDVITFEDYLEKIRNEK